jgi:hypothetical protein
MVGMAYYDGQIISNMIIFIQKLQWKVIQYNHLKIKLLKNAGPIY